jgi:hypothetical protein
VFLAATEALGQADEEMKIGEALAVVNQCARTVVGSQQAEQEAWALAAAMAAFQHKEVVEMAEDTARQAVALLQSQSIDIATVESTVGPFMGPYRAAADLVPSADDAAMAKAYVVGMVVPQEQHEEEVGANDDIEALFGGSFEDDIVEPEMTDKQVALLASFETAHHEEGTCQFMTAEREALAAMLVVRANKAREAACVLAEAKATLELAAREEAAHAKEAAHEANRAVARAEELTEEAAADAAAQEEMSRDRCHWDDDMATARHAREVHELATQRRHRQNLARRQAIRARKDGGEGSNTIDLGWGDDLL